jgi:hypothetical protein
MKKIFFTFAFLIFALPCAAQELPDVSQQIDAAMLSTPKADTEEKKIEQVEAYFLKTALIDPMLSEAKWDDDETSEDDPMVSLNTDETNGLFSQALAQSLAKKDILRLKPIYLSKNEVAKTD